MPSLTKLKKIIMASPIARSTIGTSGIFAAKLGVQAGTLVILARLLGAEQFGMFAAITAAAVILGSITNLGINILLLKEASNSTEAKDEILCYALPSILIAGFVAIFAYAGLVIFVFEYSFSRIEAVLSVGIAETIITPLILLFASMHQADRRIEFSQILISLPIMMRFVIIVFLWWVEVDDYLYYFLCSYLFVGLASFAVAHYTSNERLPPLYRWRFPRMEDLQRGSSFALLNFVYIATNEVDKVLAVKLVSPSAAGMYAAGMRVVGAIVLPVAALIVSAMPRLFRQEAGNNVLIKWVFASSAIYGAFVMLLIWWGSDVFEVVLGEGYGGIGNILAYMSIIVPGLALRFAASNILMTQGLAWFRLVYELCGILLICVLFVVLGGSYGLKGLVTAVAITEWTMALTGWILIFLRRSASTQQG